MHPEHIRNGMPAADLGARRLAQAVERQRRLLPGSQETPRRPGSPAPVHRPGRSRPHPGTREIRAFIDGAKAGLADDLLT